MLGLDWGVHPPIGPDPPTGTLTRPNPPTTNPRASAVDGEFQILKTNYGGLVDGFSSLKPDSTHLTIKPRKIQQL